jgi:hypothetical protein
LQRFADAFAAHPLAFGGYLALIAVLAVATAIFVARRQGERALWCVVVLMLVALVPAFGEDMDSHIYRIVALSQQVRNGELSLLLTTPSTGETLPTFVFYSFVPYLSPVVLNLIGLPAHTAFKIVMALELLIMAQGLRRLVEAVARDDAEARHAGHLIALLFLTANYVYAVWLVRMAFAEIWVYCLIPWVILAMMRARAALLLTALLFAQIVNHPIVFSQAFACSFIVACGLSSERPIALLRRCALPTLAALVLAAPFWLPQFLWEPLILGPAGLPVRFADSFLSIGEAIGRRAERGMGMALPLALLLMIVVTRARLAWRAWTLFGACVGLLALQTTYLRPLALRLPLLPTSLFVYRLMLPAALLGFGALLAGWRPRLGPDRLLAALALLSTLGMLVVLVGGAPGGMALLAKPRGDGFWYDTYLNAVWGRREFLPDYATTTQACDITPANSRTISFATLRPGLEARSTYLVVPSAPIGMVDYSIDGASTAPASCRGNAIFGPLKPGAVVRVTEGRLTILLWGRLACLLVCMAGLLGAMLYVTRRSDDRGMMRT